MTSEEATERSKDETILSQLRQINELEGKLREAELQLRMAEVDRSNTNLYAAQMSKREEKYLTIIDNLARSATLVVRPYE